MLNVGLATAVEFDRNHSQPRPNICGCGHVYRYTTYCYKCMHLLTRFYAITFDLVVIISCFCVLLISANKESLVVDYNFLANEQHVQVIAFFLPEAPSEMLKIFDEVHMITCNYLNISYSRLGIYFMWLQLCHQKLLESSIDTVVISN